MREIVVGFIIGIITAIILFALGSSNKVAIIGAGIAAVLIGSLVRKKEE